MSAQAVRVGTVRAGVWSFTAHYGAQLLAFATTVALARLLTPTEFGVAGYALVTISFLSIARDLGIGAAIIYEDDDARTADTAFWLGLAVGCALAALTWTAAPLAASFFHDERATAVVRGLSLLFPIVALGNVHDALLMKRLQFRRRAVADLGQALGKGAVAIALASLGLGAGSIIAGQLAGAAVAAVLLWLSLGWRPGRSFQASRARALLSYGAGTMSVNTIGRFLVNADYLFVGRYLGAGPLGIYTLAFRLPELLIMDFCTAIARVVFPAYTRIRDDSAALGRAFLTTLRYVSLATVPLGVGFAVVAEPLVQTMFGASWAAAVPVARAIAVYAVFLSLSFNIGDVYKAQGRLSLLTGIALVRAAVLLPALWWAAARLGTLSAVGWTHAAVAAVTSAAELAVAVRLLGISAGATVRALVPAATSAVPLAGSAWLAMFATTRVEVPPPVVLAFPSSRAPPGTSAPSGSGTGRSWRTFAARWTP
jgi:PST family polysaccharide transporter